MTREEIKNTPELVDFMLDKCVLADSRTKVRKRLEEVCDLAIKALEQQPCDMKQRVEKEYLYESLCEDLKKANAEIKRLSEPCEDCISRAKAIEEADKLCLETGYDNEKVIEMLNALPPVNPQEQKIGHWIPVIDRWGDMVTTLSGYKCDKCKAFNPDKDSYCPNCGARMIEPQESEEVDNG